MGIQTLMLEKCGIGVVGAAALGLALRRSTALTSLNLMDNAIGEAGAISVGAGLAAGGHGLRELQLGMNNIGDKGAQKGGWKRVVGTYCSSV